MNETQEETTIYCNTSPGGWVKMLENIAKSLPPPTLQTYLPLNGRVIHHHHCPKCYEVYECNMPCTIEPDLDDPQCHPGKQFGTHCECFDCTKASMPLDKDFWDRYHGFKR